MRKLNGGGPRLTEALDPRFVGEGVVEALFPVVRIPPPPANLDEGRGDKLVNPIPEALVPEWDPELGVSQEDLASDKEGKAPGPDGIPSRALALAIKGGLSEFVEHLMTECLRTGRFPPGVEDRVLGPPPQER